MPYLSAVRAFALALILSLLCRLLPLPFAEPPQPWDHDASGGPSVVAIQSASSGRYVEVAPDSWLYASSYSPNKPAAQFEVHPLSDTYDLNPDMVGPEAAEMNRKIRELAAAVDGNGRKTVREKLVKSLAPSIHELENVKTGLLCQLFDGTEKSGRKMFGRQKKSGARSNIHILLCGDPSTARA